MARNQQDILVKIRVLLEGLGNVRALAGHIKGLNGGGGQGGGVVALAGDIDKLSTAVDRLATAQEKASSKGGFVRFLVGVSAVVNTLSNIPQAFQGISKLLDFFDSLGGSIGGVVAQVKAFASSLFSSVSSFVSGAGAQAGAAVSGLGGAVAGLGAALGGALPFIAAAAAGLAALLAAVVPLAIPLTGLAAAVGLGVAALFKIAPAGIEANRQLEQVRLGVAAVITSLAELKAGGVPVEGAEKFRLAMLLAADQVQKLRVDAINTTATFEQIAPAFQEALAPGLAAGLTMDEVRRVTVQVVQAAGALNIPLHQVNQEVRSILEGSIDLNARLAKALDISAADIKLWKQKGTLAEELNKKLGGFAQAGVEAAQTLEGLKSNLQEALNVFNQEATTRAFAALKDEFKRLLPQLFDFKSAGIAAQFQTLARLADDVLTRVVRVGGTIAQGVVGALKKAADFAAQNRATIDQILNLAEGVVRQLLQGAGVVARVASDTGTWKLLLVGVQGVLGSINALLSFAVQRLREAEPLLRLMAFAAAAGVAAVPGIRGMAAAPANARTQGEIAAEVTAQTGAGLDALRVALTDVRGPAPGGGGGKAKGGGGKAKGGGGGGRQSQVKELTRTLAEADIDLRLAEAQAKFEAIRRDVEASVEAIQNGLDDAITSISEAYRLEAALADKALKAEQSRLDAEVQAAKERRDLAVKNLDPKLTEEEKRLAVAAEDKKLLTETTRLEAERKRLVEETADRKAALVRDEAEANRQLLQSLADVENELDSMSRSSAVRADAAAREIEARFEETRRQLVANFGEASEQVKALDRLIAGLSERAKFQELTGSVEARFSELRDLVELLSVGVESGQIKAKDATKRRVELEREYKRVLLDEIEGLAEIARRTGDPALLAAVRQLQIEWAKLGQVIDETAKSIDDTLRRGLEDTLASIITRTESVGDAFRKLAQSILAEIARILAANFVEKLFGGVLNTGSGNSIGNILGKILGGASSGTSGSGGGQRPGSGIENIPLIIKNFSSSVSGHLRGIGGNTSNTVSELRGGFGTVGAQFNEVLSFLPNLLPAQPSLWGQVLTAAISAVAGELGGALSQRASGADEGPSQPRPTKPPVLKRHGGGRVSGPGTGTSDSILALLSNGEFVIRAVAARMLGPEVLHFLNNFGRLPALPEPPRFAFGGPVGAFALEGINPPEQVGGDTINVSAPLTINTPNRQSFNGSEAEIHRRLSRATMDGVRRAKSRPRG